MNFFSFKKKQSILLFSDKFANNIWSLQDLRECLRICIGDCEKCITLYENILFDMVDIRVKRFLDIKQQRTFETLDKEFSSIIIPKKKVKKSKKKIKKRL